MLRNGATLRAFFPYTLSIQPKNVLSIHIFFSFLHVCYQMKAFATALKKNITQKDVFKNIHMFTTPVKIKNRT